LGGVRAGHARDGSGLAKCPGRRWPSSRRRDPDLAPQSPVSSARSPSKRSAIQRADACQRSAEEEDTRCARTPDSTRAAGSLGRAQGIRKQTAGSSQGS
ncbi:unnamed protein product, partial [Aphanomyces euteiches]